jgi:CheY-like chemotaxis protein
MRYQILLVDDDEVDVMMVERAFLKAGFNPPLVIAKDGFQALNILRGEEGQPPLEMPIVIMLDINMPRMNGIEFLDAIRKDNKLKFIPTLILTSSQNQRDVCDAYNLQVAGYIVKPLEVSALAKLIGVICSYWQISEMVPSACTFKE